MTAPCHRLADAPLTPPVSDLSGRMRYATCMFRTLAPLLLALAIPAAAFADDSDDNLDLARAAVASGEILPLAKAVEALLLRHPGRIIEAEFERDDGVPIYELELVTEDGRLIDAEVDARTGAILEVEEDD